MYGIVQGARIRFDWTVGGNRNEEAGDVGGNQSWWVISTKPRKCLLLLCSRFLNGSPLPDRSPGMMSLVWGGGQIGGKRGRKGS